MVCDYKDVLITLPYHWGWSPRLSSWTEGVPVVESNPPASEGTDEPAITVAKQAFSLLALLNSQNWVAPVKTARQCLGEGLGSIPKRV